MKRLTLLIIFIAAFSGPVMANYYIDLFPVYVNGGDAKNQLGGGAALGLDITAELKALYRLSYSLYGTKKTISAVKYDADYSHFMNHVGVEYIPYIPFLSQYGLTWRNSVYAGFSMTQVSLKTKPEADASDTGFSVLVSTGIGYELMQHFSLFMDAGWHHSFYNGDFSKSKIYGIQAAFGVRFAFHDTNDIGSGY